MAERCTQCGKKLGGFGGIDPVNLEHANIAKYVGVKFSDGLCMMCFQPMRKEARQKVSDSFEMIGKEIDSLLLSIPILTYPPNQRWDYEDIGLVTSQAAIGTGPISQVLSSWTDFLGKESGTYNEKLQQGERSCMGKIRFRAALLGANCIVGSHVTYTELTSGQGMLLVCISGTAIFNRGSGGGRQEFAEKFGSAIEAHHNFEKFLTVI